MRNGYTKLLLIVIFFVAGFSNQSKACYANFNHTNACAGDTVWFYGLDISSLHAWDFGDSTFGAPNLAFNDTSFHVYNTPGTYYVTHFVNIGAEWAFETQIVTIGTQCFNAAIDAQCNGALTLSFINRSVGKSSSYSWNFGEPSSGINDTSSFSNGYHVYTAAGNYTVTLIISDGTQSDTATQVVQVKNTCMSVYISYLGNPCYMDTAYFYYGFTGVTGVSWNFGDTASGNLNQSSVLTPKHIFSSPGVYVGSLTYSNGIDTVTIPVITNVVDCSVWPGDANRDGEVSGEDIFPIALYYGDTGVTRNNATLNFTSQSCIDWSKGISFGNMYLQDMVDKKQADCNGDGVIDSLDVKAITKNIGKVHKKHNNESQMQLVPASAPLMSVTLSKNNYVSLEKGEATLSLSQVVGIYGFCVTIQYDPKYVNAATIAVDFISSWLDTIDHPNLLTWYYNDTANGLLTIVSARTNHKGRDGKGELAEIKFDFLNMLNQSDETTVNLGILPDAKVLSNSLYPSGFSISAVQNYQRVNLESTSANVTWEGINNVSGSNYFKVYPSPATDVLNITSMQNVRGASVKVYDAMGRLQSESKMDSKTGQVNFHNLAEGIYLLEISDGQSVYRTKFVVDR